MSIDHSAYFWVAGNTQQRQRGTRLLRSSRRVEVSSVVCVYIYVGRLVDPRVNYGTSPINLNRVSCDDQACGPG